MLIINSIKKLIWFGKCRHCYFFGLNILFFLVWAWATVAVRDLLLLSVCGSSIFQERAFLRQHVLEHVIHQSDGNLFLPAYHDALHSCAFHQIVIQLFLCNNIHHSDIKQAAFAASTTQCLKSFITIAFPIASNFCFIWFETSTNLKLPTSKSMKLPTCLSASPALLRSSPSSIGQTPSQWETKKESEGSKRSMLALLEAARSTVWLCQSLQILVPSLF